VINIGFNSDMDNYLSRKRQDSTYYEHKKQREDAVAEDETMEDDESYEEKKESKGIISRIKGWLSFDDEEEEAPEETNNVPDDLLEALKIQNKWLKQLPSPVMKEFKSSEDYRRYKEILETYNLLKK